MGYAPPEYRRFRCVSSYFCYCILLKKHGFKSKPYISVRMLPLVQEEGIEMKDVVDLACRELFNRRSTGSLRGRMRHFSLIVAVLLLLITGVGSAEWPWPPHGGERGAAPFPQAPPFPSPPPFPPDRPSPYRTYPHDPRYRDPGPDRFTIHKGHKCEVRCERIGRSRDYHCREYRC
jgi:hypothetical protein